MTQERMEPLIAQALEDDVQSLFVLYRKTGGGFLNFILHF